MTPQTVARQASLSFTNSRSLLRFMSIESMMPSNRLILCCPLLLLRGGRIRSKIWINVSKKASPAPPPTGPLVNWTSSAQGLCPLTQDPGAPAMQTDTPRPQRPCLCPHCAQMISSLSEPRATANHHVSAESLPHFHMGPK